MPVKIDRNTYVVKWSETRNGYVGTCLEFAGLEPSFAATQEKALKAIIKSATDMLDAQAKARATQPK